MPNPNQLWIDMGKLNALYEELLWDPDDELTFRIQDDTIVIINESKE